MKLVTLHEPYATLVALGAKRIETRGWRTNYRGPLAIHSAKRGITMDRLEYRCWEPHFQAALGKDPEIYSWMRQRLGLNGNSLTARRWQDCGAFPFGKINAVVTLLDCLPMESIGCLPGLFEDYSEMDTPQERAFGTYEPGRWGFVLTDAVRLSVPIPFKSRQGKLLDVPLELEASIRAQMAVSA